MRRQPPVWRRQRGAIHILYLGTLPLVIGVMGLMIDLSRVQARKAELQVAVDAAALAAAKSLQGAPNNYAAATTAAGAAINFYNFSMDNANLVALPAATVKFGAGKDGPDWRSAAAAAGTGYQYAKVDSNDAPAEAYGKVDTVLVHLLALFGGTAPSPGQPVPAIQLQVGAVAVAGPLGVNTGLHQ
jgi:Flp pilus assembly protein TadG